MFSIDTAFEWLATTAVISLVVLGIGAFLTWCWVRPVERLRCIQATFVALLAACALQQVALLPQARLGWLPADDVRVAAEIAVAAPAGHRTKAESRPTASPPHEWSDATEFAGSVDANYEADTSPMLDQAAAKGTDTVAASTAQPPADIERGIRIAVLAVFGVGASWSLFNLALGVARLRRLRRTCVPAPAGVVAMIDQSNLPRSRRLAILMSPAIDVPLTYGAWRATILLPTSMVDGSRTTTLRNCLAHELSHVRRYDVAQWWALAGLAPFLWYQPLYWVLRRELRLCQDQIADQFASDQSADALSYAEVLVELARFRHRRQTGLALTMSHGRSNLYRRIQLLVSANRHLASVCRFWTVGIAAAVLIAAGGALAMVNLGRAETAAALDDAMQKSDAAEDSSKTKPEPTPQEKTPTPKDESDSVNKLNTEVTKTATQQMLELPIRVIDKQGNAIPGAKVTPWGLRSSQGHGLWRKNDEWAKVNPKPVRTDADGKAIVLYPRYHIPDEQIRTLSVSLSVDHESFAYTSDLHIDVPLETEGPYVITLAHGVPLKILALLDGQPAKLDDVYAFWSDGRSWQPGASEVKLADGHLLIPAMLPGENSVLLVKLDGERATHFSPIQDFKIRENERDQIAIPLLPSVRIKGVVSDNVPRPVRNGRVKAETLDPAEGNQNRVSWRTWVPIQADGTFVIDGWPVGEKLQVIALCDGYVATSGEAPPEVINPRDPNNDPFNRAQVFMPKDGQQIEVAMTPQVRCVATAVDEDRKPIAGVTVESWPNVGWWNSGSQLYCHPLVRGERLLHERNYTNAIDEAFPQPFRAVTNAEGKAVLGLPAGKERLAISSEVYELPVFLGHRDVHVALKSGETTEVVLALQPRGTEKLGEWDKLAGVVFGCSTREGRRICALPGVQQQMDEFAKRFREGKNQRDPKLLAEAYSLVSEAFFDAGDAVEGAKWRTKAAEQAAKAKQQDN